MTILQKPETINLSGNLVDFILSSSSAVSFVLKQDTRVLFEGNYTPNDNQRIEIDVKDIIGADLKAVFSDSSEPYEQSELAKTYTAEIAGQTHSFTVIKAGVDRLATSAANFLKANWLTWQPQVKKVTYYLPESLTFYSVEASVVKVKAYFQQPDGGYSEETKQLLSIVAGKAYTVPVQYAVIAGKFESRLPAFYDVWFETVDGVRLSYIQRYVSSGMMSEDESWIVFGNSLGGFDTFRAYGQLSLTADHDHQLAEIGDITDEYNVDTTREFQKNTGYLADHERKWLLDFFPSRQKYLYSRNYLRRIVVTEDDTSYTAGELPSSYTFNYRFADAKPYLNLQRVEELPSELSISIPDLSSFTIPPRLVEFPSQNLTEGVMFPVQNPYSENWATTTIGAILSYIMNKIIEVGGDGTGGVGHTHGNFDVLKALEYIDGYLTHNGQKIKAGYADVAWEIDEKNDIYMRKDREELTRFLVSFLDGAVFGENGFISGLTGIGAKINKDGEGEFRKVRIWEELIVPLLSYNRVDIVAGDLWLSAGGGIIATVFPDTDAEGNILSTGMATLKLEEGEIGRIKVDDIDMGIWHSGSSTDAIEDSDDGQGNFTFAGFSTAYWRITEVIGENNNTFRYALRPGFNIHPQPQMVFSSRGNFSDTSRQRSIYITRAYVRLLIDQNDWEIRKQNIGLQFGDLSNLNIFGLNMQGYSIYLNSVYFTGTVTQVKPDGTPVRTANDRGAWENNTRYDYYDRVSHDGCIWLCVNEDGTDTEPMNTNPSWLKQVDRGMNGQDGTSFRILGSKDDPSQLPQEGNEVGDGYLIQGHLWVWSGTEWNDAGNIQGPAGESVQNMGGWYNGMVVPYLGVVRMGNATFMCVNKQGTYNPPYYTLIDKDGNRLKTKDGYIITGEINNTDYQLIASDGTNGKDGLDGVPGKDGVDGKTLYTWIRYADDAEGNGISNEPSGKAFIGFAYNKETPLESNTPSDYIWSDIKGEDGVPGAPGKDGKTNYTWIAYSDNADGNPMYQQPTATTQYIGIAINKETPAESSNPTDYTWSKFKGDKGDKGEQGLQGLQGEQGIPGRDGADGRTTYFHIKYSANPDGNPMTNTPSTYIGTYVDFEQASSDDYKKYSWARFQGIQGEKGDQGIPGYNGEDGRTTYLHIKYSNDNGSTFTGNNGEDPGDYIGQYQDFESQDSSNPADYKWALIKGEGYTQIGPWYEGLLVPKLGVVTMGGNSFAAKVATYNPPMFTLIDKDGNRLKTKDGYIITGEINYDEYLVLAEKGEPGKDGSPGKDGADGAPGKDGADGKQGIEGCVVRDSEWAVGTEYRNDSNVTDGSLPVRYIDVVLVRNDAVETGWDAYRCKITHVSSDSITYANTSYWEKFGVNVGAIFTSLILAKNAKIKFLQGNELTIAHSVTGKPCLGLSGSVEGDKVRIWCGSELPDSAPFKLLENGDVIQGGGRAVFRANGSGQLGNGGISWDTMGRIKIDTQFKIPYVYLSGEAQPSNPQHWTYYITDAYSNNQRQNFIATSKAGQYHEIFLPENDTRYSGVDVCIYNDSTETVDYNQPEDQRTCLRIMYKGTVLQKLWPRTVTILKGIGTENQFLSWTKDSLF